MESVAPDSLVGQAARQREGGSDLRLGVVKGGVEAGDLRQCRMEFCNCRDGGEMMRLMQRRQWDEAGQFGDHLGIDTHRPLVARPAMHDAVPGRDQLVVREIAVPSQRRSAASASSWVVPSAQILVDQRRSGAVLGGEMSPVPESCVLAFAKEVLPRRPLVGRETART